MSKDEMFNKLYEIFINEEVRLQNKLDELEAFCRYRYNDKYSQIELIETRANLSYFKSYMLDVLNYLKTFDR